MIKLNGIPLAHIWTFTHILPGTFKRNKAKFAHHDYPILAPLPTNKAKTKPIEELTENGPFLYFVMDSLMNLCYLGKTQDKSVIKRWVRPGNGGPSTHYWSHSTESGGSVFNIAKGLKDGLGPYHLYAGSFESIIRHVEVAECRNASVNDALALAESFLIRELNPTWNIR